MFDPKNKTVSSQSGQQSNPEVTGTGGLVATENIFEIPALVTLLQL